jgi:hypothetical protein
LRLTFQGKYSEAERLQKEALKMLEKVLNPTHSKVAEAIHFLAKISLKQGLHHGMSFIDQLKISKMLREALRKR